MTTNTLDVTFTGTFFAKYRKHDNVVNPNGIIGDIRYNDLQFHWITGNGNERANLLYYQNVTLIPGEVLLLQLDGNINNIWGEPLDYDAVKFAIIKNNATDNSKLEATFKDDIYKIGGNGYRVFCEPLGPGVTGEPSSDSSEEGSIRFENIGDSDLNFDFILVGSEQENTSSGV